MTVLLVRHSSTAWSGARYSGTGDPPLDERGRRQLPQIAADVRQALGGHIGAAVVCSPSLRARETADAIAAALGAGAPRADPDWREADFGEVEGLTWDELEARFPEIAARILDRAGVDWPGGEPHAAFAARVQRAWSRTVAAAPAVPIVIVAHTGSLRLAASLAGTSIDALAPGEVVRLALDPGEDGRS
jgi:broad specificity phosphatase PhoE